MSNLDQGVSKNTRGCQIDTGLVSNSAPNDTDISDTDFRETEIILSEDEEEKAPKNMKEKIKTNYHGKLIELLSMIVSIFGSWFMTGY